VDSRDRQNLAVALVVVALVVATYWLMNAMSRNARLEECLMARQRNCERIVER
jgi:hypothetical protein